MSLKDKILNKLSILGKEEQSEAFNVRYKETGDKIKAQNSLQGWDNGIIVKAIGEDGFSEEEFQGQFPNYARDEVVEVRYGDESSFYFAEPDLSDLTDFFDADTDFAKVFNTTLDEAWGWCNWDQKFEHSTPSEFDHVFDNPNDFIDFIQQHEEETDEGFWKLHYGMWSNDSRICADFIEYGDGE